MYSNKGDNKTVQPGQTRACYRFSVVQVLIVFHADANSSTSMLMNITHTHKGVHHQSHIYVTIVSETGKNRPISFVSGARSISSVEECCSNDAFY